MTKPSTPSKWVGSPSQLSQVDPRDVGPNVTARDDDGRTGTEAELSQIARPDLRIWIAGMADCQLRVTQPTEVGDRRRPSDD